MCKVEVIELKKAFSHYINKSGNNKTRPFYDQPNTRCFFIQTNIRELCIATALDRVKHKSIAKPKGLAIGIGLGTTHSRVAVVRDGKVGVIADEIESFSIPSLVSLNDSEQSTDVNTNQ